MESQKIVIGTTNQRYVVAFWIEYIHQTILNSSLQRYICTYTNCSMHLAHPTRCLSLFIYVYTINFSIDLYTILGVGDMLS